MIDFLKLLFTRSQNSVNSIFKIRSKWLRNKCAKTGDYVNYFIMQRWMICLWVTLPWWGSSGLGYIFSYTETFATHPFILCTQALARFTYLFLLVWQCRAGCADLLPSKSWFLLIDVCFYFHIHKFVVSTCCSYVLYFILFLPSSLDGVSNAALMRSNTEMFICKVRFTSSTWTLLKIKGKK